MKPIKAWHFVRGNEELRDGQAVEVGKAYHVDPPLELCERGLHASRRAIDALWYAPGPVVCRVELSGEMVEGADKLVATDRKVIGMADATKVLHEFACWCAERALRRAKVTDQRSWNAIKVKRAWLAGKATNEELAEARKAAWEAARDAAWEAAWGAAWEAARDAAWEAARDAARAVWEASGAAKKAAVEAERATQSRKLERLLNELLAKQGKKTRKGK